MFPQDMASRGKKGTISSNLPRDPFRRVGWPLPITDENFHEFSSLIGCSLAVRRTGKEAS